MILKLKFLESAVFLVFVFFLSLSLFLSDRLDKCLLEGFLQAAVSLVIDFEEHDQVPSVLYALWKLR